MANIKISALPSQTANTINSWLVINDSGETTTYKTQLIYSLGLTNGTGNSSIKSNSFLTALPTEASSDYVVVLGNGASANTAPSQVIIGNGAYGRSEGVVCIGKNAHDQGTGRDHGIAIGTDAEIYQPGAISIGYNAAGVQDSITIGKDGRGIGNNAVCIGYSTFVAGNEGLAIGYDCFQDRVNASVIGASSYVSGTNSTIVGADNGIGETGGDADNSTVIGVSNQIYGPSHNSIAIGYNNRIESSGMTVISSAQIGNTGELQNSHNSIVIGTNNLNIVGELGSDVVMIGGVDTTVSADISNCVSIGGSGNTLNSSSGTFNNNVLIGLQNRTPASSKNNTGFFENLFVYGQIEQQETIIPASQTTVDIDISTQGVVELTATGGTYNIDIDPVTSNIGLELTLMIHYYSAATINFVSAGNTQWKWGNGAGAPVFSGNNNYNILVFRAWDGNDLYEQSRSMWMS
jgi:hypothetical protein